MKNLNVVSREMAEKIANAGWRWRCEYVYAKHKAKDKWKLLKPTDKRHSQMQREGWYILDAPGFDELMIHCAEKNFHFVFSEENQTYSCHHHWGGVMFISSSTQAETPIDALGSLFCRKAGS